MPLDFYSLLFTWQEYGFFDIVLPFLLIFTLSFAVLQKTKILGNKSKNLNIIVALVLGFLFLQNTFLLTSLQHLLPNVSFALVVILAFLLVTGMLMGEKFGQNWNVQMKWASWIALLVLLWALFTEPGGEYGTIDGLFSGLLGSEVLPIVIFIILVLVAVFAVKGEDENQGGQGGNP